MKKKYTDIFLDFDDTLYDTRGNNTLGLREIFDHCGWERYISDFDGFVKAYWQANDEVWTKYSHGEMTREVLIVERFRKPLTACVAPGTDLSWITDDYCREVSDRYLEFCSCKPGTVEGAHALVSYLRQQGYRLHICSNGFHEVQYKKLRASQLYDYFDHIILSEDAGINKPSPAFFDYAFRETHAHPSSTLMIGDNYSTDVLGAISSGIDAIWFNRWNKTQSVDSSVAATITSLKELEKLL